MLLGNSKNCNYGITMFRLIVKRNDSLTVIKQFLQQSLFFRKTRRARSQSMLTQKSFRHNELIHLQNLERQGNEHSILRVAERFSPLCYGKYTVIARRSSVAKGGGGSGGLPLPPIGLKSMQNNLFLVLLRPIFAKKMKTALPMGLASRNCEGVAVIWTRKVELCVFGPHLNLVRKSD